MRFVIVDPRRQSITPFECEELRDALVEAGIDPNQVDHGVVQGGLGIVVYEYGLFDPPAEQKYFAIGRAMFAGPAVLYGFNETGATTDVDKVPMLLWMPTREDCELAFAAGMVERPAIRVNNATIWKWPDPRTH